MPSLHNKPPLMWMFGCDGVELLRCCCMTSFFVGFTEPAKYNTLLCQWQRKIIQLIWRINIAGFRRQIWPGRIPVPAEELHIPRTDPSAEDEEKVILEEEPTLVSSPSEDKRPSRPFDPPRLLSRWHARKYDQWNWWKLTWSLSFYPPTRSSGSRSLYLSFESLRENHLLTEMERQM